MSYVNATFTEFDQLQQVAMHWNLDFRLLSKNDLETGIKVFTSDKFQLGRVSLNGKIDQYGLCPIGYRSVVIPVPGGSNFYWLNQLISKSEILIYPKDGTIDAVSYNQFDVYIFSIEEQYLMSCIDNLKYSNCQERFSGNERILKSTDSFCNLFHQSTQEFLELVEHNNLTSVFEFFKSELDELFHHVLGHIEQCSTAKYDKIQQRRNSGLNMAVEIINHQLEDNISISALCSAVGLSERSLQYAFREKYQITPKEYIKAVKLNKIKEQLQNNEEKIISSIAAKYGFWHMGQFAADFKRQFGVLPSKLNC